MRWYNENGFVIFTDLQVPLNGSIQAEFRCGAYWYPCCMMPNLTTEEIQSPCNGEDWIDATQYFGLVRGYQIREDKVYWNFPLNREYLPASGPVTVRIKRAGEGGELLSKEIFEVTPDLGNTVILNDFFQWKNVNPVPYTHMENWRVDDPTDVPNDWYVASDEFGFPRLVSFGQAKLPPVSYCPGLSGKYDLYLAAREQVTECELLLPGGETETVLLSPRNVTTTRFVKEIFIGTYAFKPNDSIGIARRPATEMNRLRRFGDILYLKLVPACRPAPTRPSYVRPGWETVLYAEPYSACYFRELQNEEQAERLAESIRKLGVDTVFCQSGRLGCRMMHYSKVSGSVDGSAEGDDREVSNGAQLALRHMEVTKVLCDACHRQGMRFLVNLGINSPYSGTSLECEWAAKHHHLFHPYYKLWLDFTRQEVLDFAADNFAELAEYDFDGFVVDLTRNPYGLTADILVNLFRLIVKKIGMKRRKELEIGLVMIEGHSEETEALKQLLKEDLVDTVCVGHTICTEPELKLGAYRRILDAYPGKKLYGKMDAWSSNHTGLNQAPLPRPEEYERQAEQYSRDRVDGLYFYQGEQILLDPFLKRFVRNLKA